MQSAGSFGGSKVTLTKRKTQTDKTKKLVVAMHISNTERPGKS